MPAKPAAIPKKIEIGPWTFIVFHEQPPLDPGAEQPVGRTVIDLEVMNVDPRLSIGRQREVLFHEVLHVEWARAGLYGFDKAFDEREEEAVAVLSTAILDTLRRNPILTNYLLG